MCHRLNTFYVNVAHILKHISCRKTAGHEVLEDVIDERDIFVHHSVNETADTANSLKSKAKFEKAAHLCQIMQKAPVIEFKICIIERMIDRILKDEKGICPK